MLALQQAKQLSHGRGDRKAQRVALQRFDRVDSNRDGTISLDERQAAEFLALAAGFGEGAGHDHGAVG